MKTAVQIFGYRHAKHNLEALFFCHLLLSKLQVLVSQISFL